MVAGAFSNNFTYNFLALPVVRRVTLPAVVVFTVAYLDLVPLARFFVDQVTFAVAFRPALVTTALFSRTVLPVRLTFFAKSRLTPTPRVRPAGATVVGGATPPPSTGNGLDSGSRGGRRLAFVLSQIPSV